MFKNLKQKCALVFLSTKPLSVFAHAGHDHHSNWSFLVHAIWLAPIILVAYIVMNVLKNKKLPSKEK